MLYQSVGYQFDLKTFQETQRTHAIWKYNKIFFVCIWTYFYIFYVHMNRLKHVFKSLTIIN